MTALILIFKSLIVGTPVLMLLATLVICFRDMSKSYPKHSIGKTTAVPDLLLIATPDGSESDAPEAVAHRGRGYALTPLSY
jgi:hypothetical protein